MGDDRRDMGGQTSEASTALAALGRGVSIAGFSAGESYTLFLFGEAHRECYRESIGSTFAIFDAKVRHCIPPFPEPLGSFCYELLFSICWRICDDCCRLATLASCMLQLRPGKGQPSLSLGDSSQLTKLGKSRDLASCAAKQKVIICSAVGSYETPISCLHWW